jgi:pyruvate kinase|tara:strand:+ start:5876 stop:6406 length:531 start_codon:yes stop_codon:yes gene_type:complete
MILLSNHLLTLEEFKNVDNVVVRINMAHVKDKTELKKFVNINSDVFLDYPKGRSKPPVPTLHVPDALEMMAKYPNIKYFAVSNIETPSEVKMISSVLPKHVSFVPKIETLDGVINLASIFETGCVKHIMLDAEDLYTDVNNDTELYLQLKERVKNTCKTYNVELLELYGVIFKGDN